MTVRLREETPSDAAFVRRLLAEAVSAELVADSLPPDVRGPLIEAQCRARRQAYASDPGATSRIALDGDEPAGWCVVSDRGGGTRILSMIVAGECRGRGLGTAILARLANAADWCGKPLTLSVAAWNRGAIRLYERMGFQRINQDEISVEMERNPDGVPCP